MSARFVRQVVNGQAELLRLPGDRGGLRSLSGGLLRVVLDPLIFACAVTNANKVGAVLGRIGPSAYGERSISPARSGDFLPAINRLDCEPFPRCNGAQGPTITTQNVALCSTDENSTELLA